MRQSRGLLSSNLQQKQPLDDLDTYDFRPGSLAGGPGPHFSPAASRVLSACRPPSNADHRLSEYSSSNYSKTSPKPSPEVVQKSTFAKAPHSTVQHAENSAQTRNVPSSKYSRISPFVDTIQEVSEPSSSDKPSRRTSDSTVPLTEFVDAIKRSPELEDHDERPSLVRQASLGRRHQSPKLTTISRNNSVSSKSEKSVNYRKTIDPESPPPLPNLRENSPLPRENTTHSAVASSAALRSPLVPPPLKSPNGNPYPRGKGSPSPKSSNTPEVKSPQGLRTSMSPASAPTIPRARTPLSPPESRFSRATAPGPGGKLFLLPPRKKSLKERVGNRRPLNLDMNAVKEAEARGSITSLPSLINRALTLASNIEGGKTSSKNTDWFGNDLLKQLARRGKSTASLGHVLEGFTFSPHVDNSQKKNDWDSPFLDKFENARKAPSTQRHTQGFLTPEPSSHSRRPRGSPRRTCCGMPLWLFVLLLVTLVILIALAVILPVVLVVVPKQNQPGSNLGCSSTHRCSNDGISVVDASSNCRCICRNNFSGSNCTVPGGQGCGTIQVETVPDATIGDALLSLISDSQGNFQIPLNTSAIVPLLSSNELNCQSQNALVTLNSLTSKRSAEALQRRDSALPTMILPTQNTLTSVVPTGTSATPGPGEVATSNGLQIAGTATQTSNTDSAPISTPAPSGLSSGFDINSPQVLHLAQTAILYVLQASGTLRASVVAQSQLQSFFNIQGSGLDPTGLDLGNGYNIDLGKGRIWGNGKSVGNNS